VTFGQWIGLLVLGVCLYILWEIRQVLLLVFLAVVLATALNWFQLHLQRLGFRRGRAIASISLLVGGIGIMNIMLVSVTERTQEIGLRKAIGATQRDILAQFMIEAIILSALGGLLGTGLGVGGVLLVAALTPLEAGVAPVAVVLAVGVSGSIGLFFGVVPAQRAAQLDPIVALRSA